MSTKTISVNVYIESNIKERLSEYLSRECIFGETCPIQTECPFSTVNCESVTKFPCELATKELWLEALK